MTYNLRLVATPETYNDETRYKLVDHHGAWWSNHRQAWNMDFYGELNEDNLERWKTMTSETVEQAFRDHAPVSSEYGIIAPNTDLLKITIEALSADPKGPSLSPFYTIAPGSRARFNPFPQPGEYFAFMTVDGVQECFLYSDIKHISFKES